MSHISYARETVARLEETRPVCTFASVGSHQSSDFAPFHGDRLSPVYVEWVDDESIFACGPRSWVCGEYVAASERMGGARQQFRVLRKWSQS